MTTTQRTGNNDIAKIILAVIVGFIVVKTCSTSKNERNDRFYQSQQTVDRQWQKSPLDVLIKSLSDEPDFTILLYDMNAVEQSSGNTAYKHQYKVLVNRPDTVLTRETEWYEVSPAFFQEHIDDMGMEIASKKDGVLHKQVAPAGYSNYVGNQKYGQWVDRGGSSFWEFYGKYAFMSSVFHMVTFPARRAYWNDYYHGGYYGGGRAYYGPSGSHIYGTSHYTSSGTGSQSTWGQKSSGFRENVRSRVSRSASSSRTRSYSSSSSYSNTQRTTRSSSRSSRSSSFRSRGGGFGK